MTSRERVIAALKFKSPGKIPLNLWFHQATRNRYGQQLDNLIQRYPNDIDLIAGPGDRNFYSRSTQRGRYVDTWGSSWLVLADGMVGEVKEPALKDLDDVNNWSPPYLWLDSEWEEHNDLINKKIEQSRNKGRFVIGAKVEPFQRMQFVRGTENLFMDIGLKERGLFIFLDKIAEYFDRYLDYWLDKDVDGIFFTEDWGSQISLLISPKDFTAMFKPIYRKIIDKIQAKGKYIFFHSDGYIYNLYKDLIDLGVDAVNSQIWIMDLDEISRNFRGKICFWGEIDRQNVLAFKGPEEIYKSASKMKEMLTVNGGGLIGQSVAGVDVSIENIEALCNCW
ncbi:uroporphyrinogen decarboxylase family protein [Marispirochaeta aestuarii]|nr:uroporphyrinogen decarboxylase family protein [Marispirochaeta aestuarii]